MRASGAKLPKLAKSTARRRNVEDNEPMSKLALIRHREGDMALTLTPIAKMTGSSQVGKLHTQSTQNFTRNPILSIPGQSKAPGLHCQRKNTLCQSDDDRKKSVQFSPLGNACKRKADQFEAEIARPGD